MFQDIFDDVYLVHPKTTDVISEKKVGKSVHGYFIACVLYLVKKLNGISQYHRMTMQILEKNRKKLSV